MYHDEELKMMYKTHIYSAEKNPICLHTFNRIRLDENILQDTALLEKITENAYNKYKRTSQGKRISTVDVNPLQWTRFLMEAILSCNTTYIKAPNGCCNSKDCGIKKYYEIVYDLLLTL
tara:strand:- start:252 stop:608 length:357 start_codon:yes stop_codon:yes gene_type:complete